MVETCCGSRNKRNKYRTDAANGMRSHEECWTPGGRGNFPAATKVLFLVSLGRLS